MNIPDNDEDTLDWKVFSELWMKEKGNFPNYRDKYHFEAFHWFTQGALSELLGHLNPNHKPASHNTTDEKEKP